MKTSSYPELYDRDHHMLLVPRVASRTLRSYFPSWVWEPIRKVFDSRLRNMGKDRFVSRDFFDGKPTVACVRNPYQRVLSIYKAVSKQPHWQGMEGLPFPDFVRKLHEKVDNDAHFVPASQCVHEDSFIVKLEEMVEGFKRYNELHDDIEIDVESICHYHVGETKGTPTIYQVMKPELQDIIDDVYAEDFDRFGYSRGDYE